MVLFGLIALVITQPSNAGLSYERSSDITGILKGAFFFFVLS